MLRNKLLSASSMPFLFGFLVVALLSFNACDKGKGNTATLRLPAEPNQLNPVTTEDASAVLVSNQIFLQLLDFDPQTLALVPVLAKALPIISTIDTGALKGSVSYTFEIRDEATWDDGSPVTAADVVFTFKAILNKKAGANNQRSTIDFLSDILIDPANPKKVTFVAGKKYFLADVNIGTLCILPEKIYDAEGIMKKISVADLTKSLKDSTYKIDVAVIDQFAKAFQNPKFARDPLSISGCGAYKLAEWKPNERLVLQKKQNWWGDKLAETQPLFQAYPEQINYKIIADEPSAMAQVTNGELDAMTRIPAKRFLDMQKNDTFKTKYSFHSTAPMGLVYIGFNNKNPLLNDRRVRRAVAHLLDCKELIVKQMQGFAEPIASAFIPTRSYYNRDLQPIELNIEQAKKLLAEAGWKDTNGDSTVNKNIGGAATELNLRYCFASANTVAKTIGLILQENAKKAGVKIELVSIEAKAFTDAMKKRECDMFLVNAGMSPPDDDPKEMWATSSNTPDGGNKFQFENKQADVLIEQIRSEINAEKRAVLYKQFQKLIYDEQPAIFLFASKDRVMINNRFEGIATPRRPGYLVGSFKLKK